MTASHAKRRPCRAAARRTRSSRRSGGAGRARRRPRRCAATGFRMPDVVSQYTTATWVMAGIGGERGVHRRRAPAARPPASRASACARPMTWQSRAMRAPYAPLTRIRTLPSRGTKVPSAASTTNVPLPWSGTATRSPPPAISASRRRTRAVMAMNALSREPQSWSIARFVLSAVVSGPGVRSHGSRDAVSAIGSSLVCGCSVNRLMMLGAPQNTRRARDSQVRRALRPPGCGRWRPQSETPQRRRARETDRARSARAP